MKVTNTLKVKIITAGYTQKRFAEEIGATNQQVSNWVVGRSLPPLETALKIAQKLNTTVDGIWSISE